MNDTKSSMESVNEIYQGRVDALAAANEKDREHAEQHEADSDLESVEQPLSEEARFVANPDELRKEVDSEEKFSEGLEDGEDTLETPEPATQKAPAKKAAAKK
jgi:hypothetical protein